MSAETASACIIAGCHDFMDPVIVQCERRGIWLIGGRTTFQQAVAVCRRCGALAWRGWTPIETRHDHEDA